MGAIGLIRFTTLFAALCLLASAATAQDQDIEIGTMFNTMGAIAPLGAPSDKGAKLAITRINENGGVLGRKLLQKDAPTNSVLSDIHVASHKLVSDNPDLVGVVGFVDSGSVLAAAPDIANAGMTFITSGATSPQLPSEVPTYLYLACFGDNVQAAAAAQWVYEEQNARNVTVYVETDKLYPRLLQGYFRASFEMYGGVVRAVHAVDPSDKTGKIRLPHASDVVFLSTESAENALVIIKKLREHGYEGLIVGGDGYDAPEVWAANPDIGEIVYTTHAYLGESNKDEQVRAFVSAYEAAYPGEKPTAFSALAYDAIGLVKAAIERSGEATPDGLLQGLAGLEDYQGVTGTISYNQGSRIPLKSVTLMGVEKGELHYVGKITPRLVATP
ncbi:ABC transporter substrate-binding protein [Hoeflea sp. CAU 1731]